MAKKMNIIAAVSAAAILSGCARVENGKNIYDAWADHDMDCYTKVVEIEGHKYIIMSGGNIIHAASCDCMNK